MYIHVKLVHRVSDSFVSLLLCGSCIIRVTTHGHQCVSWTREKLRAGMYLRMQVRIQPHPVGSPLGVGDFFRISHGFPGQKGAKYKELYTLSCNNKIIRKFRIILQSACGTDILEFLPWVS